MAKRKSKIHLRHGAEADALREAGCIAAGILRRASEMVAPGLTTGELDRAVGEFIREQGCTSAFLGYRKFPANACISVNEEVVHGIGGPRALVEGDIVKIDVGIKTRQGWIGDNAKTVVVGALGSLDEGARRLLQVTEASLYAAIAKARAGAHLSTVCASVAETVESHGFTVVKQFVGHGVGRKLHEEPQVPNYWDAEEMGRQRSKNPRLEPGMVLAIEPMVNAGTDEVLILKDGWTVITKDRQLSAHYEHSVLITEGEAEILTPRERSFPEE